MWSQAFPVSIEEVQSVMKRAVKHFFNQKRKAAYCMRRSTLCPTTLTPSSDT